MRHAMILCVGLLCAAGCSTTDGGAKSSSRSIELFNGKDLSGWTCDLKESNVKMEDVWTVRDGVLRCAGKPSGYLRTLNEYENYVLTLDWRWPKDGKNNGVLVHVSTPRVLGIWPKSIEVQIKDSDAGDFWIIGTSLHVENEAARRTDRRYRKNVEGAEKPLGQWNTMEITCRGDEIFVKVNGVLVNRATQCSVQRGAIALQSEGPPCEYRNVRLRPLP